MIDDGCVVMGKEPVLAGGELAGFVTSAAFGCSLGQSIAYAWLPTKLADLGTQVEVQYLAERHSATVAADPLIDPEGDSGRQNEQSSHGDEEVAHPQFADSPGECRGFGKMDNIRALPGHEIIVA